MIQVCLNQCDLSSKFLPKFVPFLTDFADGFVDNKSLIPRGAGQNCPAFLLLPTRR